MFIVGLGNPGGEYTESRHNAGRMVVDSFRKSFDFSEWTESKKHQGLIAEGKVGKKKVILLLPGTFMNRSGGSVKTLVTSKKKAEDLVVVYDEIDMALGAMKIVFNRGSGGHKGIESIARSLGTKEFTRLRMGISPSTPGGKIKKPQGDKKVVDFVIGNFSKKEKEVFKKVQKKAVEALCAIIEQGRAAAMNKYN